MRTLLSAPPTDRVGRYPKHTFRVNSRPFSIQPFFSARVLPGETLRNLYFESRVVTTPVLNPIIGWKQEYYFFYVRITDLLNDAMKEMFVDPTNAEITASVATANNAPYYEGNGGVQWTRLALQRIAVNYFRDQDEPWNVAVDADSVPIAQIRESTFMDSLTDKDAMPEGAAIATATDAGDLERLMEAFEQLRALGIANMSYEDWLRSQGIAIPNKDENKPEMLARFSEYQYPSNTVEPTTGIPTSAVSWVFKNGERSPKFFKEPGFLIGVSVTRPKVYFGGLTGSAHGWAKRAWDWMPNYLRTMPETALKYFALDTGPVGARTTDADAYFLDMRDELIYGDQFQNLSVFNNAPSSVPAEHLLALPDTALNWRYPTAAMAMSFFSDTTNGRIKMDGYVSLSVKGHEVDFTARNAANI